MGTKDERLQGAGAVARRGGPSEGERVNPLFGGRPAGVKPEGQDRGGHALTARLDVADAVLSVADLGAELLLGQSGANAKREQEVGEGTSRQANLFQREGRYHDARYPRKGEFPGSRPGMTKAELSAYMRRCRLGSGMTQTQVAEKMGIKQSTVSSWEIGANEPGIETLTAWGEAIGAPLRLRFDRAVPGNAELLEAAALLPADDCGRLLRVARAFRRLPARMQEVLVRAMEESAGF